MGVEIKKSLLVVGILLLVVCVEGVSASTCDNWQIDHPEWIDFPREGNNWSYHYARRQWSLADNPLLRYRFLAGFDRDMIHLIQSSGCMDIRWTELVTENKGDQVLAFLRGDLL